MPKGILHTLLRGEGALVPHVQPMYRLSDNRLVAREYLARYEDAAGQTHPVGPLLQEPSLSNSERLALDLRFLEATFQTMARIGDDSHLHFVNLEPVSLEAPGFWEALPRWLEALPFGADRVVMEFTESQGNHDAASLQVFAQRIRSFGLSVAVDDLGAGVASLSHMARLAPDYIKADRSLVEQVHRRPYQAALLNALAHFANAMRIGFIAEGIESMEELESVMDAGVPWGQGFILGQPWPTRPKPIGASES
jgi:EAL domain-containing protein (putative c-di-GMP-specific phosphodiesterase class I)